MSQFIEMFGGLCQDTPWSDVVTITNGKAYPEEYQEEGAYPICGSGGIMCYGEKKLCNGNTTILGRKGNINNPIFMESGYWIVDTAFSIDVDKAKLHPKFFYYWCCQYDFTKLNKQGVLPSLARKDLEKVKMAIPQMRDQLKFVSIAEQADKSKFGDFKSQFVEMFGNTPMSYEMQDCFSLIRNGANIKQGQFEGGIPITRIETISDEIVDRQKMGYAGIADNKYELYYLQDGDILISHINSLKHIGKCALYNKKENESIIHGMNLLCLRPNIVTINPVFAIHMLRSNIIRKGITDITKPAVNQASFSAKDFGKLRTIIPPMDKQMLFVSIAEQADKSKSVIQKALVYLNDIQSDELGKIA
ncbi:restriction endonuclease subunit S [Bacteroides caccae]|uniref:restriction endonuclease subunit S n=1 Tax=Bacteroides caccae TaxID=47678 RepID=UPI0034A23DFD